MWRNQYNQVHTQQQIQKLGSFIAGMLTAQQGRPITDCPYKRRSKKKAAWIKGWKNADKALERTCANICRRMSDAHNDGQTR